MYAKPRPQIPFTGYLPDPPDERDVLKSMTVAPSTYVFDLKEHNHDVLNQGKVGACTGYSVAAAIFNFLHRRNPERAFLPSPYYLYARGRVRCGWPNEDRGAYLRETMKVLHKDGIAPEPMWSSFNRSWKELPGEGVLKSASLYKIKGYERIQVGEDAPDQMMSVLQYEKLPIVIGVRVFPEWRNRSVTYSGNIPMPAPDSLATGGHAMYLHGFDSKREVFIGTNSWGYDWGWGGRFTLPFDYFKSWKTCHDLWTLSYDYE